MSVATDPSSSVLPSPSLPPDTREDLHRYAEAGGFTLRAETHPWYAALDSVSRLDEARAASTLLAELRGRDLPLLEQAAERLSGHPGLENTTAVGELAAAVSLLLRVHGTRGVLRPEAFEAAEEELQALVAATASSAWRTERGVRQSWWQRSRLTRRARRLATTPRPDRDELHRALDEAATARTAWAARAQDGGRPSLPREPEFLQQAGQAAEAALTELAQLAALIRPEAPLEQLPLADLIALLDRLAADEATLFRLPRLHELRASLAGQDLDDLLAHLTDQQADLPTVQALTTPPSPRTSPDEATSAAEPTTADELPDPAAETLAENATDTLMAEPELPHTAEAVASEPEAEAETTAEQDPTSDTVAAEDFAAELATPAAESQAQEADTSASTTALEAAPQAQAETEAAPEPPKATPEPADAQATEPATEEQLPSVSAEPQTDTAVEAALDEAASAELADPAMESEDEAQALDLAETLATESTPEAAPQAQAETEAAPAPEAAPSEAPAAEPADSEAAPQAQAETEAALAPVAELPAPAGDSEAEAEAQGSAQPEEPAAASSQRAQKPAITPGRPVTAYAAAELEALVRWIDGDGTSRSDDELLRAAMKELGFARLGPRIKEALGAAVAAARG